MSCSFFFPHQSHYLLFWANTSLPKLSVQANTPRLGRVELIWQLTALGRRCGHLIHLVNIIDVYYCPGKKLKWFFGVVICAAIWDATYSCGGKSPVYQPALGGWTRSIQLENVSSMPFDDQRKASTQKAQIPEAPWNTGPKNETPQCYMKVVASLKSQLQDPKMEPSAYFSHESPSIFEPIIIFFEAALTFFGGNAILNK